MNLYKVHFEKHFNTLLLSWSFLGGAMVYVAADSLKEAMKKAIEYAESKTGVESIISEDGSLNMPKPNPIEKIEKVIGEVVL